MNAITSNHFTPYATRHAEDLERARRGSKRNAVLLACVLGIHVLAGYAFIHMRVHGSNAPAVPIEVEFIAEQRKPEEPKISPPKHVEANVMTSTLPSLDVIPEEVPVAVTPLAVVPSATPNPQRSDGEFSTSPRLISDVAYVRAPKPKYPSAARALRLAGTVVLRVLIDERGRPVQVSVHRSSGHRVLDEAAQCAASEALFKPYLEDGEPHQAFVLVPIEFGARSG